MERNHSLRRAREARPSPSVPGASMSQGELAEAVNDHLWHTTGKRYALDAHAIARYERGKVRWPSAAYRAGLKAVLGVESDADLGFGAAPGREAGVVRGRTQAASSSSVGAAEPPVPPVSNRPEDSAGTGFVPHGASGGTWGLEGEQGPAEFLAATVVETPAPARVGWTDVEYVRGATRAIAMSENVFGGGLCCEAACSQLRWVSTLLSAEADSGVRRAMHEAVGNLSSVVAFSAFDISNHEAADRYFRFALWCAEQAGSWALRANTLAEMARKAIYLGDLDDALTLIELAQVREDRLSATARAMLWTLRARVVALSHRTDEARVHIDRADACFAERDPQQDPPWLCYYDEAEHQGSTAKALLPLALHTRRPTLATPRLRTAIRLHEDDYPRSRAFSQIRLASLLMAVGDPHEALPVAHQALTSAQAVRSTRITRELRGLEHAATAHTQITEVKDLRRAIAETMRW